MDSVTSPVTTSFQLKVLLWREQNQFVLCITQIPLKSPAPRSFKREGTDSWHRSSVALYLWEPSCKNTCDLCTDISEVKAFFFCSVLQSWFSVCLWVPWLITVLWVQWGCLLVALILNQDGQAAWQKWWRAFGLERGRDSPRLVARLAIYQHVRGNWKFPRLTPLWLQSIIPESWDFSACFYSHAYFCT